MKALVVEDDPTIVDMVEDVLFSLGYEFAIATNQQNAKELLAKGCYDFVLLDLQIPAKANRGGADKQYGINFLKDIQRMKAPSPPPVIMMTAHLADCLDLSAELQRNGVREFIAKPFSSKGRTLSSVIQGVLDSTGTSGKLSGPGKHATPPAAVQAAAMTKIGRFSGGELVFNSDRVTLCGQTIFFYSRSKQTTQILEALNQRTTTGAWVAKSGPELVSEIGVTGGQNSVTCSIRAFRDSAAHQLKTALGLDCEKQDIIRSGGCGYRFHEWITIRDLRKTEPTTNGREGSSASRQDKILDLLRDGAKLRSTAIALALDCSLKTVKRELDSLRLAGQIEFIGPNKTGTYQLVNGLVKANCR
jgi:CheY-like chemotaxis protein